LKRYVEEADRQRISEEIGRTGEAVCGKVDIGNIAKKRFANM
jgi:hypothetical protein